VGADVEAGRRMVNLRREDIYVTGNGETPLTVARIFNNLSVNYSANLDGRTMLGPRWHMNYEMCIESAIGTADMLLRKSNAGLAVLQGDGSGTVWNGRAHLGEVFRLQKLSDRYKLTSTDPNAWYEFDLDGHLTLMQEAGGNSVRLVYQNDRLFRAEFSHATNDIDDRYLQFEYLVTPNGKTRLYRVRRSWDSVVAVEYRYDEYDMLYEIVNAYSEVTERYVNRPVSPWFPTVLLHEVWARETDGQLRCQRRYVYEEEQSTRVSAVLDGSGNTLVSFQTNWGYQTNSYLTTATAAGGLTYAYVLDFSRNPKETIVYGADGKVLNRKTQGFLDVDGWHGTSSQVKTITADGGGTVTVEYLNENPGASAADRNHVKSFTYADGSRIEYEYDANYRVTKVKKPLGRNTSYTYNSKGLVSSVTDPMGFSSYYFYDAWGRLVKEDLPTSITRQYAYNAYGRVTATTDTEGRATVYQYNPKGLVSSVTAGGVTVAFAYNSRDRLTTVTDPIGNKVVTGYDAMGRKTSVLDPLGLTTQYDYDTTGRLVKIRDAAQGEIGFGYDPLGRMTALTDQRGYVTKYAYDALGRLVEEENPLGKKTRYTFGTAPSCGSCGSGGAGKLAARTNPDNQTTSYTYDLAGRLKKVEFAGTADYVELTRDLAGRVTGVYDARLPAAEFPSRTFTTGYDANDRATTVTWPDSAVMSYSYNALGRRLSMTDPDGNVTAYRYATTANNRKLDRITHPVSGATDFWYRSTDALLESETTAKNDFFWHHADYAYDSLKRLSSILHWEPGETIFHRETYQYNAVSMPTRIDYDQEIGGTMEPLYSRLFSYDTLSRLTQEAKRFPWGVTARSHGYQYDPSGNRTRLDYFNGSTTETTTFGYNAFNQLVQRVVGGVSQSLSYDDNGNRITRTGSTLYTFLHDRSDRLVAMCAGGGNAVIVYNYDASGRRILQTSGGNQLKYYFDGLTPVLVKERPAGGSWRTKRVYATKMSAIGQIIAEREVTAWNGSGIPTAWTDRAYAYDMTGNVVASIDYGTGALNRVEMEAFGNVLSGDSTGPRLTTKELDPTTGLYWFGARWYDPAGGQWLQQEPLRMDGPNIYWYGRGNAVNGFDADGRVWGWGAACVTGVGGAVGAAAMTTVYEGIRYCYKGEFSCKNILCATGGGLAGGFVAGGLVSCDPTFAACVGGVVGGGVYGTFSFCELPPGWPAGRTVKYPDVGPWNTRDEQSCGTQTRMML
jgi:RHS repeat-associated protein